MRDVKYLFLPAGPGVSATKCVQRKRVDSLTIKRQATAVWCSQLSPENLASFLNSSSPCRSILKKNYNGVFAKNHTNRKSNHTGQEKCAVPHGCLRDFGMKCFMNSFTFNGELVHFTCHAYSDRSAINQNCMRSTIYLK